MKFAIPLIAFAMLLTGPEPATAEENEMNDTTVLISFDQTAPAVAWRTVNDGVMGGISSSRMQATEADRGLFTGNLSLANNGGFASVRTRLDMTDLSDWRGLEVRVRGDGRTYQVRLRNSGRFDGIAYRAMLPTSDGEWATIRLPFAEFVPTYRGRILRDVPALDTASVIQLSLMVADKTEGPFRLEVSEINVYRDESNQP